MLKGNLILLLMGTFLLARMPAGPDSERSAQEKSITNYEWRVVRILPHDPEAFTQGLIYRNGFFYESTGRKGKSSLRKVCPDTGEILQQRDVEDQYFAEGLTDYKEHLVQITLNAETGFIYDMESFERIRTFRYTGEGWGLTFDGDQFIMSDGSSDLKFLDPETFEETGSLTVIENGNEVADLNELEMINGKIFANVLFRDEIIEIDPESGVVTGKINLEKLVNKVKSEATVNVLNGIAYNSETGRIYVTGKFWPNVYEIEIKGRE
jgi:glutamine cyclotransferase